VSPIAASGTSSSPIKPGPARATFDSGSRPGAADYLRDRIVEALSETVSGAKQIMAWLQAVAEALAEEDIPFRWETPTGNTIQQSYWDHTRKEVKTLAGTLILQIETPRPACVRKNRCSPRRRTSSTRSTPHTSAAPSTPASSRASMTSR
jgi:DNA-directed RNA polymerase